MGTAAIVIVFVVLTLPTCVNAFLVVTVAGGGVDGSSNAPATSASLANPAGVTMASNGSLIVADTLNNRVFSLHPPPTANTTASGNIVIVAGTGSGGYYGDSGPALLAMLLAPAYCVFSASHDLYIADSSNSVVRRVTSVTQVIWAYAGIGGIAGYGGDGGPATAASLNGPSS